MKTSYIGSVATHYRGCIFESLVKFAYRASEPSRKLDTRKADRASILPTTRLRVFYLLLHDPGGFYYQALVSLLPISG